MIALAPEMTLRSKKESYANNGIRELVCPVSRLLVPSIVVVVNGRKGIVVRRPPPLPPPPSSYISRIPNSGDENKLPKDPDRPA